MELNEICRKYGGVKADWHRHPNGGGWVCRYAQVDETVFVGEDAVVDNYAIITGHCWIRDRARISHHCRISGRVEIFENASISGSARIHCDKDGGVMIHGKARVIDDARVSGEDVDIFDDALISEDASVFGRAKIFGKAILRENAEVYGDCIVAGKATIGYLASISKGNIRGFTQLDYITTKNIFTLTLTSMFDCDIL